MGARRERRKATLPKYSLDYQELKSNPKSKDESKVDDDQSELKIVVGKDELTGTLAANMWRRRALQTSGS